MKSKNASSNRKALESLYGGQITLKFSTQLIKPSIRPPPPALLPTQHHSFFKN